MIDNTHSPKEALLEAIVKANNEYQKARQDAGNGTDVGMDAGENVAYHLGVTEGLDKARKVLGYDYNE